MYYIKKIAFIFSIFYVVMPIYIGEMSPKEKRGQMMSTMGPGFAIGILIGLGSSAGFARFEEGWRVAYVVLALSGLLYALGFLWLPHTPRYSNILALSFL